jgi:hypothetical protein
LSTNNHNSRNKRAEWGEARLREREWGRKGGYKAIPTPEGILEGLVGGRVVANK